MARNTGCMDFIYDTIEAFIMGIVRCCQFIKWLVVSLFMSIVSCFEFVWYPIKENYNRCCGWCGHKNRRSSDPTYSPFGAEV